MSYEVTTIESICSRVLSGGTPRRSVPEYYRGGCIPWLNTKEIDYNRIYKTENHITPLGLERSSAKWIAPNSVIVAMYGATAGKVAINKIPVTTNQACCNLEIDSRKADYNYVYYYLKWKYPELSNLASGAAQQNLNVGIIKAFPISLPPLEVQKVIGETLSCLDAKIDLNDRMNENLEKQAQAIFKSWFVDFEPFHYGEFVDSVIGPIPKGWKACAVTDVIDVNPKRKLDKGTSAKYLSMANVSTSGPRVLGWEQRNFTSGTCFMNGDVLLARITPSLEHGKTAFVDFLADQEVGWGSTEFIVMRSREPLPLEYTYCLAKHEPFREHMIKSMTGTSGRQRAQVDALKHYFLAIAPKDVYAEFQEIVIPFFLAIRRNATENQVLAALRDTLLPKLMSGEIEVPVV
ncbi:MAG TPA: restriction endonuclease subunit S [Bacillota bacterium]|nr:restriction endonuclease subunit S [Bacillota bacterium]